VIPSSIVEADPGLRVRSFEVLNPWGQVPASVKEQRCRLSGGRVFLATMLDLTEDAQYIGWSRSNDDYVCLCRRTIYAFQIVAARSMF